MLTAAVARELDRLGLVTFGRTGTDCFLQHMPAEVVDAVGLFAEGGGNVRAWARTPGVQVLVRRRIDHPAGRSRAGYDVAAAILAALHDTSRVLWGGGTADALHVTRCWSPQAAPVDIGTDDTGAHRWSVRFDIETSDAAA